MSNIDQLTRGVADRLCAVEVLFHQVLRCGEGDPYGRFCASPCVTIARHCLTFLSR